MRNYFVKYQLFKLGSAFAAVLCTFHAEVMLFVRKSLTERFKNIIPLFAGIQKNSRSDLGSERGRLFLGTGEGNVNFAFSQVSFPHALKLRLLVWNVNEEALFFNILACISSQSASQEQREKRVTVDEVPSGIYLYPEEESETDKILTPPSTRYSSDLFDEGKKDILKLMGIEVSFLFLIIFIKT